jgi:hypothetical protein
MRCAYEFQRFEKVAWTYLKKGAKLVFEVGNIIFCRSVIAMLYFDLQCRSFVDVAIIMICPTF